MRGAKCVVSAICDPPKATLTTGKSGNDFFRSQLTMELLPAKKIASLGGGLSLRRFSMSAMDFSQRSKADLSSARAAVFRDSTAASTPHSHRNRDIGYLLL